MSEEEKKAIETLETEGTENNYLEVKILLNLVEKQQKEIEELNEIKQQICNEELITQDYVKDNFIAKSKIREMIKHYNNELEHIKNGEEFENEKPMYYWGKVALEDLLEEN